MGTEEGSIYVFGDGFQYMRPWLTSDPIEVVSLVAIYPNKVLAAFADNSIVVMELPSLNIVDLLQPNWLGARAGDITTLHSDLPGEKAFVFAGTSEGTVHVLDVMEGSIRICDYSLGLSDFGLSGQTLSVADLHLCPKDDKYLAVGFDGADFGTGALVIYDLSKSKVHKTFKVPGVTSLAWHHAGELLFAGTMGGDIFAVQLERGTCVSCWNSKEEVNDDEEDQQVAVRRISWLAPQGGGEGCLFLLLSSAAADNDNLKNVIIGLSPEGPHAELSVVFSLPPVHCEKVINYRIVPTCTKGKDGAAPTPALLLLTQRAQDNRQLHDRRLRIIRCPATPMADWALEIGALPDPRMASEVLPASADATCLQGVLPDFNNPLSIGKALVEGVIDDEGKVVQTTQLKQAPSADELLQDFTDQAATRENMRASRRLSARAFFANHLSLADLPGEEAWEMVLACGQHEEHSKGDAWRNQDVLFVGHADGTIVVYGVSAPAGTAEVGRGNIWLPLAALRCATSEVTCISCDESSGLVAAGDEAGFLVLYELRDVDANIGAIDLLNQVSDRLKAEADILSAGDKLCALSDFHEDQIVKQFSMYDDHKYSSLQEVYRTKLPSRITALAVLGALQRVFVGTENGSLFVAKDLRSAALTKIETDEDHALLCLHAGYLPVGNNMQAVMFAYFASGRLLAIDIISLSVIAVCSALKVVEAMRDEDTQKVTAACILALDNSLASRPVTEAVLYSAARLARIAAASPPDTSSEGATSPTSPPEEVRATRRTFFGSRATTPKAPLPSPAAPAPRPDSEPHAVSNARGIDFELGQVPAKLCFVHNRHLVTFDLRKVGDLAVNGRKNTMGNVAEMVAASHVKELSAQPIVAAHNLFFSSTEGVQQGTEWSHYLGCVDSEGTLRLVSAISKKVVCTSSLLEGVTDEASASLSAGALLGNGSAYLLHKGSMIFTCGFHSADSSLRCAAPDRASPFSSPLDASLCLAHGREAAIANNKAAVRKRRSSVINLTAGPTDLYKIFAKTREQKAKDDLLKDSNVAAEEESAVRRTARNTSRMTSSEMAQIKENFEERGEKINRIALKMENFKQNAADFRAVAKAQREQLQAKNARWGLF